MKNKHNNSDDIQFTEKLIIDWNFKPDSTLGKRAFPRLSSDDLTALFEVRSIQVRISRPVFTMNASLLDLSQGGLAILVRKELFMDSPLKVAFHLSRRKITSKCSVRHVNKLPGYFKVGLEFIDLSTEDYEYIAGLYSSNIYCKASN